MSSSIALYSFRRCPYAIRARLALANSAIEYEHREVVLKDKPPLMLALSPKGTVPVLVLADGRVIDESLDVMLWALAQNDPDGWLNDDVINLQESLELLEENDFQFKTWLDRYKYFDRFPEYSQVYYRQQAEGFIANLETRLAANEFIAGSAITLVDMAIAPFIRQFAHVDKEWFFSSPYANVIRWLNHFLDSTLFIKVMQKKPVHSA